MRMERDEIERRAPGGGPEAVHARLRATAELLDDRPGAGVERAAREMLGRLDTLQAEHLPRRPLDARPEAVHARRAALDLVSLHPHRG